jgi:hypothetical protein
LQSLRAAADIAARTGPVRDGKYPLLDMIGRRKARRGGGAERLSTLFYQ